MRYASKAVGLIAIYLFAAKLGLVFGTVNGGATIFWPPSGIALVALLLGGLRYLPVIFTAACLAGFMLDAPLLFILGSALGNTLEPLLGMLLLRRYARFDLSLNRISDLYALLFLGGMLAACASALLGPLSLLASGLIGPDKLLAIIWRWWRADVLGVAFIAPLLLVYRRGQPFLAGAAGITEIILLWSSALLVGNHLFLDCCTWLLHPDTPQGLVWIFPLLIWAGFRTSKKNLALLQLLLISQALLGAYWHQGWFADDISRYELANFWLFAILISLSGMSLAILVAQQRQAAEQIALSAKVFSVTNDGVLITDARNQIIAINPAFTRLTGYTLADVQGKNPSMLASGEQNPDFYKTFWKALLQSGHWEGELWNKHKSGHAYLEKLSVFTLEDAKKQVVNYIGIFSDITSEKARQEHIRHLAQHDFLTNLPNRFLFRDHINQQIAQTRQLNEKFALIYLDLNKFKPVNDQLGHQIGDQLLVAVADRLRALIRKTDMVARLGGDEFAILISGVICQQDIDSFVEKIMLAIEAPFTIEGHEIAISTSVGIAIYPDDGDDMDNILAAADQKMYRHKLSGYEADVSH